MNEKTLDFDNYCNTPEEVTSLLTCSFCRKLLLLESNSEFKGFIYCFFFILSSWKETGQIFFPHCCSVKLVFPKILCPIVAVALSDSLHADSSMNPHTDFSCQFFKSKVLLTYM